MRQNSHTSNWKTTKNISKIPIWFGEKTRVYRLCHDSNTPPTPSIKCRNGTRVLQNGIPYCNSKRILYSERVQRVNVCCRMYFGLTEGFVSILLLWSTVTSAIAALDFKCNHFSNVGIRFFKSQDDCVLHNSSKFYGVAFPPPSPFKQVSSLKLAVA